MKRVWLTIARSMVWAGLILVSSLEAGQEVRIKVLFLGDSITAGLGVEPDQAYPFLVEKMIKDKGISGVTIINGSISGSTTASALSRLKWFQRAEPDILVLALGANDGLRGLSVRNMAENLDHALALAKDQGMAVILAGMEVPPNYGLSYAENFRQVFADLAAGHDISLIPFLLKDVGGNPEMNQADGIHPNVQGHQVIARTVFPRVLEEIEKKLR